VGDKTSLSFEQCLSIPLVEGSAVTHLTSSHEQSRMGRRGTDLVLRLPEHRTQPPCGTPARAHTGDAVHGMAWD